MKLLLSVIGLALATLRENKIRSFLTVLGVIIGTGTIIARRLDSGRPRRRGHRRDPQHRNQYRDRVQDAHGARLRRPHRRGAQAQAADLRERRRDRGALPVGGARQPVSCCLRHDFMGAHRRARYKGNDYLGSADRRHRRAVTPTSGQAEMLDGRFFTDTEDQHHMPVAVIGEDLYKALFGPEDAIGKNDHRGRRARWK